MSMSRRAARMERHHKRGRRGTLNMVSLMDIFTILVFFLLVSSTEVEVLPTPNDLTLPESIADEGARETVIVTVTATEILFQGRLVAKVEEVIARDATLIPELRDALLEQADRLQRRDATRDAEHREVTIMGDRGLPYSLLRQVMATCTDAQYGRISLAVTQRGVVSAATGAARQERPAG